MLEFLNFCYSLVVSGESNRCFPAGVIAVFKQETKTSGEVDAGLLGVSAFLLTIKFFSNFNWVHLPNLFT